MTTIGTVLLWTFAGIGLLSTIASVGVWLFTWRLDEPDADPVPASEVVARHTGNVRVVMSPDDVYTVKPGSPGTGSEYVEATDRRRQGGVS